MSKINKIIANSSRANRLINDMTRDGLNLGQGPMTVYEIIPVSKPRMTQRDKWKKRASVLRYRAFRDEVRLNHIVLHPGGSRVVFTLPMPAGWSKDKKALYDGAAHQQKPDIDNLTKALFDALFDDDSHIYQCSVEKYWGSSGSIGISHLLTPMVPHDLGPWGEWESP